MGNNYTNIVGIGTMQVFKYGQFNASNTLYVSTAGIDGTHRTGSASDPFRTLAYAISRAVSGQVIHLNEGVFNLGAVQLAISLGISIEGSGIDRTIIRTSYTNVSSTEGAINLVSPAGAILNGNQFIRNLTIDGNNQTASIAISVRYRENITIENVKAIDFWSGGITFATNKNINVEPVVGYASNNHIKNCVLINCGSELATADTIGFYDQMNGSVYKCTVDNTIRPEGSNIQTQIRIVWIKNVLISECVHYRHDHELARWNFFVECWNYTGELTVINNIYYGHATVDFGGNGNRCDMPYKYGLKCAYNKFLNNTNTQFTFGGISMLKVGIDLEGQGHEWVLIHHNYIQRYGFPIVINTSNLAATSYIMRHIYVFDNLLVNVGFTDNIFSNGILLLNENPAAGESCLTEFLGIFNNTITGLVLSQRGISIEAVDILRYTNISNNLIVGFSSNGLRLIDRPPELLAITGVRINNNNLFDNGINVPSISGTVTQVDTDTTGNLNVDPLFLDADNYHVSELSPCRNAGVSVFGLEIDFDNIMINDRPTIGCYHLNQ